MPIATRVAAVALLCAPLALSGCSLASASATDSGSSRHTLSVTVVIPAGDTPATPALCRRYATTGGSPGAGLTVLDGAGAVIGASPVPIGFAVAPGGASCRLTWRALVPDTSSYRVTTRTPHSWAGDQSSLFSRAQLGKRGWTATLGAEQYYV